MRIEVTSFGVEIHLFDNRADPTFVITIDPMDTDKAQLLAEILNTSHVQVDECGYGE